MCHRSDVDPQGEGHRKLHAKMMGSTKFAGVFSRLKLPDKLKGGRIEKIGTYDCGHAE